MHATASQDDAFIATRARAYTCRRPHVGYVKYPLHHDMHTLLANIDTIVYIAQTPRELGVLHGQG